MAFNISVKSEPKGEAKGVYQCEISDNGLILTKGKKHTIDLPVGSKVKYLGKNQMKVRLPEYKLEMTVAKFGIYQDRLADDLTQFLKGEADPPELGDYSLPWFLFGISALPIGIPILTLGGAIPGMIGFGLAAGCFGIAQKEDLSLTVRIASIVTIVVMSYAALFAMMSAAM